MLDWLACRFAPRATDPTALTAPDLPDPSPESDLAARTAAVLEEVGELPFRPRRERSPYRHLWAMACRDLVTREADQHPDTAGRTPNYDRVGGFEPVEIPVDHEVTLTGHRSTGAPGAPVVIVVHGLFDSHTSRYVVDYAEVLRRWGFHVVALDLRDHGRLRGRKPPTSLGLFEGRDLFAAARTLADAEDVSVGILGLSYGGQCAVRAAHEATVAERPDVLRGGVMAICSPLNVHEAVLALDDPDDRLPAPEGFVDRSIMRELMRTFRRHRRVRVAEMGKLEYRVDTHDEYIRTAVLPAYPDEPSLVGAFLGRARSARPDVMSKLAVPTLLVHAEDDPLVPAFHTAEAMASAQGNPMVGARILPAGGHVGLFEEDPDGTFALLATFFGRLRDG